MYLVWKILGTLGRYVDNESIPLKIIFISVFTFMQESVVFLLIPTYSLVGKHHVMERSKHIWPFKYI